MKINLTINGQKVSADVAPNLLLVDFLRDNQRLTGTHVGCDTSQCGACTVHVNGASIKSCTMLAVSADGADVKTIEGMGNADGSLGVIQREFQQHHGLQCGFCTPGMIMAAAEIIKHNPKPSEEEIRHGLEGNICRCTGYHNIVKAVSAAASELRK